MQSEDLGRAPSHPFGEFLLHPTASYFDTELVDCEWTGFGAPLRMPSLRRPLGALLNPLIKAGFTLEYLLEPTPTEQFRELSPGDYEELSCRPGFLCVLAERRRSAQGDAGRHAAGSIGD